MMEARRTDQNLQRWLEVCDPRNSPWDGQDIQWKVGPLDLAQPDLVPFRQMGPQTPTMGNPHPSELRYWTAYQDQGCEFLSYEGPLGLWTWRPAGSGGSGEVTEVMRIPDNVAVYGESIAVWVSTRSRLEDYFYLRALRDTMQRRTGGQVRSWHQVLDFIRLEGNKSAQIQNRSPFWRVANWFQMCNVAGLLTIYEPM